MEEWIKDRDRVYSNSFNFTLLKEENGKIWLGDDKGNGVIIRK